LSEMPDTGIIATEKAGGPVHLARRQLP